MPTFQLRVRISEDLHDLVVAELADLGFDAFESDGDRLRAYVQAGSWDEARREEVTRILERTGQPFAAEEDLIPDANWNELWEASMHPVDVPPFLIKPSWRPMLPEYEGRIVLEVDPKMSFGTGYHPSTRLALRLLADVVRDGDRVLDAGCGTGILALAALKRGAEDAIGFDVDEWSTSNAMENAERNRLAGRLDVREGTISVVPETGFGLILANINRGVLLELLPALEHRLADGGSLVMAGVLSGDRDEMLEALSAQGLVAVAEADEAGWWAVAARRTDGAGHDDSS